eukprot:COSAG02_NODE_10132_length_2013_cov_41.850052_1_plen_46_part_10
MLYTIYTMFTMYVVQPCTTIVQLLYNYVYCDLPYVHIKRFKCIMSL